MDRVLPGSGCDTLYRAEVLHDDGAGADAHAARGGGGDDGSRRVDLLHMEFADAARCGCREPGGGGRTTEQWTCQHDRGDGENAADRAKPRLFGCAAYRREPAVDAAAAQAGLEVEAYTVNDAELADALTSLGVVGITTNTLLPAATTAEPMQLQDAEAIVARFAQDFTMTSELEP